MKNKKSLPWIRALLFYLVLGVFFFHDSIFSDRIQVATDTVMNTYPWALALDGPTTMRNPGISDQSVVFYPWFAYTRECLQSGEIPLWTPHALGGVPYLGNLSTAIFYPLNLLLAVLPVTTFFCVQCVVKLALAGFFLFLFLRRLGLGSFSSLFGGTVYALSGYTVLWVISNLTSVSILFPAMLWATERYLDKRDRLSLGLVSLLLGLQFLGAHPETSLCICSAWIVYVLFRIRRKSGWFTGNGIRSLLGLLITGVLSVGMVLFQLWPFLEYLQRSWGLQIRSNLKEALALHSRGDPLFSVQGWLILASFVALIWVASRFFKQGRQRSTALIFGVLGGASLVIGLKAAQCIGFAPHFLIQLFPDLYGTCLDGVKRPGGVPYPELNGGYVGALALLLAIVAMIRCRKRSPVGIFTCLFLLSFGTVHAFPLITQLIRTLPAFDICQPGRILCVTAFSVSVLAAFGLEHILDATKDGSTKSNHGLLAMRVTGFSIVVVVSVSLWGWSLLDADYIPISEQNRIPGPEGTATDTGITLTQPRPGEVLHPKHGLRIEGTAGADVTRIRFSIDGWGLGETPLIDHGSSGLRTFLQASPMRTEGEEILDWMTDGIHQLGIHVESSTGSGEAYFSIPIQVRHARQLTEKNTILFFTSVAVLLLLFSRRANPTLKRGVAIVMVVTDLALFGMHYNCTSEPETLFPDTLVTEYLSQNNGVHRILPENAILQPSTHYLYEYQTVRGYDGLEVPAFNQVVNLMKKDPMVDIYHFNSKTMDYESPVLDVLGIRYILTLDELDKIPGLAKVLDGTLKIYENMEAMPRAFVVGRWLDVNNIPPDPAEAMRLISPIMLEDGLIGKEETLTQHRFLELLLKNYALLEGPSESKGSGEGTASLESYENERLSVRVSMRGEGWLIITDNFFPGWKAYVNGVETPIHQSLAFRAVPLEEGEHVVEMVYRPASFYTGMKISLACLALALLGMFLPYTATRKQNQIGE